jgi:hypothetical protein
MSRVRTLLIALVLLTTSCTAMKAHFISDAAADGREAVEAYRGRVVERGLLPVPVVKDVRYARWLRVRAEVLAPAEHAGSLFVHDAGVITVWWPKWFFGLRIRGVTIPGRDDVEELLREDARWMLERYEPRNEGPVEVAGRETRRWRCAPTVAGLPPYTMWIDDELALPLRVSLEDERGAERYAMRFESFDLVAPPPDDAFRFDFPEGAVVHEWDLDAPGVTLEQAQAKVEFPILLPAGRAPEKVVLSEDEAMVAVLLQTGARWLSLSEVPNLGPILVPELGLPVRIGEREGVMSLAFGFTILSWAIDTTALTLVTNLPYPLALDVAASVSR